MSGGFPADWLAARAPWDRAARNVAVEDAFTEWAGNREAANPGGRLRIVDLGSGSGNNQRHLAPLLEHPADWLLVDNDTDLLKRAAGEAILKPADSLQIAALDLGPAALAGGALERLFGDRDLVTASALFDLVSGDWLEGFLDALAVRGAALLAVLTYDGRIAIGGAAAARLAEQVNRHQHGDKGFGPALGPQAHTALLEGLHARGWRIVEGMSDWRLKAGERGARHLVEGWIGAASEIVPEERAEIAALGEAILEQPETVIRVGHRDLFACPPA